MQNIFLDTSIFVSENFLEGKRIDSFLSLAERDLIKIIMPLITVNEIKAQFEKRSELGLKVLKSAFKNREVEALRNSQQINPVIKRLPKIEIIVSEFNDMLDKRLAAANVEILPYPVVDTSTIFNKYFKGELPFSNTETKKHEFPDAFALASLQNWCNAKSETCGIVSLDEDMTESSIAAFSIHKDYKAFLNALLEKLEAGRISRLDSLFSTHKKEIVEEVSNWLLNQLDDYSLYYGFSNQMDIHDIEIRKVDVDIDVYSILKSESDLMEVEVNAHIDFEVYIIIDDEESWYRDYDDRSVHYANTTSKSINQQMELPMVISFEITSDEIYEDHYAIEQYNNGKGIDLDSHDDYYS